MKRIIKDLVGAIAVIAVVLAIVLIADHFNLDRDPECVSASDSCLIR